MCSTISIMHALAKQAEEECKIEGNGCHCTAASRLARIPKLMPKQAGVKIRTSTGIGCCPDKAK